MRCALLQTRQNGPAVWVVAAALAVAGFLACRFVLPLLDRLRPVLFWPLMGLVLALYGGGLGLLCVRWAERQSLPADPILFAPPVLAVAASAALACLLARRVLGQHSAGMTAFLLCAGALPFLPWASYPLEEVLLVSLGLLILLVWSWLRRTRRPALRLVLLAGLAALAFAGWMVCPDAWVLLAALCLQLFLERKPRRAAVDTAALLLVFALLLGGWTAWQNALTPSGPVQKGSVSAVEITEEVPVPAGAGQGEAQNGQGRPRTVLAGGVRLLVLGLALAGAAWAAWHPRPGSLTLARTSLLGWGIARIAGQPVSGIAALAPLLCVLAAAALWRMSARRRIGKR